MPGQTAPCYYNTSRKICTKSSYIVLEIKICLPLWHRKMYRIRYHTPYQQEQILNHPISVAKAGVLYNQE